MALQELPAPHRPQLIGRARRLPNTFALLVLNTFVMRLFSPFAAMDVAFPPHAKGGGRFIMVPIPAWLAFPAAVTLLHLAVYRQRAVLYPAPFLWRLHRTHHADLAFDITTGLRCYPGDIIVPTLIKLIAILVLGVAPVAVLILAVVLDTTSMLNHGNVRLPVRLDRSPRRFVVSPNMHRVHHAIDRHETNSNFGFNVPSWDHTFRTYRDQPVLGHQGMSLDSDRVRAPRELWLDGTLCHAMRHDSPARDRSQVAT